MRAVVLGLLIVCAVAVPRHASIVHPAKFLNSKTQVQLQATHTLGRPTSAEEVKAVADDMLSAKEELESTSATIQNVLGRLEEGANLLHNGICNFIGFCAGNPAHTCQEIADQPGVTASELPSGKYWMEPSPDSLGTDLAPAPARVDCFFDTEGLGWALLFDDSHSAEILQKPINPVLKYYRFKEVLAYTPKALAEAGDPVRQIVYYVDETNLANTKGKTLSDMHNYMWAGQDGWGTANDKGTNFPNNQVHNRWKYFGKMNRDAPYRNTIYILDDSDIKDEECKLVVDKSKCGQDFFCPDVDGSQTIGRIAQTNVPTTTGGVISLGCAEGADEFTMCGACTYTGSASEPEVAEKTKSSIIQKLYVR